VGSGGADLAFSITFEINGNSMSSSLVVKDNPYNPDEGVAEFRYLPGDSAGVRLTIYTVDGQEVYEHEYRGGPMFSSGDPFASLTWSGRNNGGDMVRNGVYLVVLTGLKTGEQATLKLAVIR
jgi:hypothetical protein